MRRRAAITLLVVLLLATLARSALRAPTAPPSPEPEPEPVVARQPRPSPPAPTTVLRRPAPIVRGAPDVVVEGTEPSAPEPPFEPTDLLELPESEQRALFEAASGVFDALHEACAEEAGPDGAHVMAAITLDERGILEMELSAYEPDLGATGVDDALPASLVACVDDVLWDLDWPTREGGVRFALTTPFDAVE